MAAAKAAVLVGASNEAGIVGSGTVQNDLAAWLHSAKDEVRHAEEVGIVAENTLPIWNLSTYEMPGLMACGV